MTKHDILFNIVTLVLTAQLSSGGPTENIQKINKRQTFKIIDDNSNIQKIDKRQIDKRIPIEKRDVLYANLPNPREVPIPNENHVQQFRYNPETRTVDVIIDKISDGIANGLSQGISGGISQGIYALPDAISATVNKVKEQYGYSGAPLPQIVPNKLYTSYSSGIPNKGYSIGNIGLGGPVSSQLGYSSIGSSFGYPSSYAAPNVGVSTHSLGYPSSYAVPNVGLSSSHSLGYPSSYAVPNVGLSSTHSLGYPGLGVSASPLASYSSILPSKTYSSGIVQGASIYPQGELLNKKPIVLAPQHQESLPYHWDCQLTPALKGSKLFRDNSEDRGQISELSNLLEKQLNKNNFARFNTKNIGNEKINTINQKLIEPQAEPWIPIIPQIQQQQNYRNILNHDDELRNNMAILEEMNVNWPPVSMIDHNKLVEFRSNNQDNIPYQQFQTIIPQSLTPQSITPQSDLLALYLPLSKSQQGLYSSQYYQQNNPINNNEQQKINNEQQNSNQNINENKQNINENVSGTNEKTEEIEELSVNGADKYKSLERDNMIDDDDREC